MQCPPMIAVAVQGFSGRGVWFPAMVPVMRLRLLVGPLVPLLLVSACSDESSAPKPSASSTSAEAVAPSKPGGATESRTPERQAGDPDVGPHALKVGQVREGIGVRTILQEVRRDLPPDLYRDPEAGNEWLGLRIRQCRRSSDRDGELSATYNGEWAASTRRNDQYSGDGNSWPDWPTPKFPEMVTINPGECVQGWISWEIPTDLKLTKVIWRPDGQTVAEWVL